MPRGKQFDSRNIMLDIIDTFNKDSDRNIAIKGVRNICRYFGGVMWYIPVKKKNGNTINAMRETLCAAVGERGAEILLDKIMTLYGGLQIYIPFEIGAFKDIIAEEIYVRNYHENVKISEIARDYNISFNTAYNLWKEGQRIYINKDKEMKR